jgi:hypothetical protein
MEEVPLPNFCSLGYVIVGAEGEYVVLWIHAREQNTEHALYSYQAWPCRGPWATCIRLIHAKAESELPTP